MFDLASSDSTTWEFYSCKDPKRRLSRCCSSRHYTTYVLLLYLCCLWLCVQTSMVRVSFCKYKKLIPLIDGQNLFLIRINVDYPLVGSQGAHTCHNNGCGIHCWWITPDLNLAMRRCHWSIIFDPVSEFGYTWNLSCVCVRLQGRRCYPPAHRLQQIS